MAKFAAGGFSNADAVVVPPQAPKAIQAFEAGKRSAFDWHLINYQLQQEKLAMQMQRYQSGLFSQDFSKMVSLERSLKGGIYNDFVRQRFQQYNDILIKSLAEGKYNPVLGKEIASLAIDDISKYNNVNNRITTFYNQIKSKKEYNPHAFLEMANDLQKDIEFDKLPDNFDILEYMRSKPGYSKMFNYPVLVGEFAKHLGTVFLKRAADVSDPLHGAYSSLAAKFNNAFRLDPVTNTVVPRVDKITLDPEEDKALTQVIHMDKKGTVLGVSDDIYNEAIQDPTLEEALNAYVKDMGINPHSEEGDKAKKIFLLQHLNLVSSSSVQKSTREKETALAFGLKHSEFAMTKSQMGKIPSAEDFLTKIQKIRTDYSNIDDLINQNIAAGRLQGQTFSVIRDVKTDKDGKRIPIPANISANVIDVTPSLSMYNLDVVNPLDGKLVSTKPLGIYYSPNKDMFFVRTALPAAKGELQTVDFAFNSRAFTELVGRSRGNTFDINVLYNLLPKYNLNFEDIGTKNELNRIIEESKKKAWYNRFGSWLFGEKK